MVNTPHLCGAFAETVRPYDVTCVTSLYAENAGLFKKFEKRLVFSRPCKIRAPQGRENCHLRYICYHAKQTIPAQPFPPTTKEAADPKTDSHEAEEGAAADAADQRRRVSPERVGAAGQDQSEIESRPEVPPSPRSSYPNGVGAGHPDAPRAFGCRLLCEENRRSAAMDGSARKSRSTKRRSRKRPHPFVG